MAEFRLPKNACDTGGHVYGPYDRFPLSGPRAGQIAEFPIEDYLAMLASLGLERGVITQPSDYVHDNRCILDAIARSGGKMRGLVMLPLEKITDNEVARLDALGMRGIRVMRDVDELIAAGERLRGTNWHVELAPARDPDLFVKARPRFEKLGVPISIPVMGDPDVANGLDQPSFQAFLGLLRDGVIWAKLTIPFLLAEHPASAALPYAQATVAANPKQVMYASHWPYTSALRKPPVPTNEQSLQLLFDWVPDEATRNAILAENPARFYRF